MLIDQFCYRSGLRNVNVMEKFIFSMTTLLLCILSRSASVSILVLICFGWLTVKKGGLSLRRYMKLMRLPAAFLVLSTAAVLVNISKTPLDAYAVPAGSYYITGSTESLIFGFRLILSAFASVSCLYFLSLSTPVTDLISILQKFHCPSLLIELFMLIYRFIFILMAEASSIRTAQEARLSSRNFKTAVHSFGGMASALLIRAMKRSGRLYDAMESRCYDGTIRLLLEESPPKKKEIVYIIIFELVLLFLITGR
ncbi:cobalt ECF transporter T component CbiQ [Anaerostipes sp.]|uniref:cobalt ECF transporter T component CbiQ n=1 Tax=Anaerostipes sp. TaxID=1872530 RepID=UPI0025C19B83|nr:cobalt ECF transporter T component CbiQ [Anaerostipes sp.]MBS7007361.1 cobalt ECF transporter T component CbiQ [Anaerostipes sp.]